MNEYALYKGEEILSIGTAKEIAEEMGIKVDTVYYYQTPIYKKRLERAKNPSNARVVVRLDDEGEKCQMSNLKVGDRVKITNDKGIFIGEGTIANINELREPNMKYAVDADFYKSDFVFAGEKHLTLIKGGIDNATNQGF